MLAVLTQQTPRILIFHIKKKIWKKWRTKYALIGFFEYGGKFFLEAVIWSKYGAPFAWSHIILPGFPTVWFLQSLFFFEFQLLASGRSLHQSNLQMQFRRALAVMALAGFAAAANTSNSMWQFRYHRHENFWCAWVICGCPRHPFVAEAITLTSPLLWA